MSLYQKTPDFSTLMTTKVTQISLDENYNYFAARAGIIPRISKNKKFPKYFPGAILAMFLANKYSSIMHKNPKQKINFTDLRKIFAKFPQVKLAYLFGSRATGNYGPMSDYDFAIYLEEQDSTKRFNIQLDLYYLLNQKIRNDKIDIVILNDSELPDLKFNIINEGKLLYSKEPYKIIVEPQIINEYIDFNDQLLRYGLTAKL